ncbi:hypothetical protein PAECIP111893_00732 [Paenibacillus plantiphilus]|uniref:DNA alkylation repair protein n=1 Tax=Paenibacillus plantiphilus TaxID=2905650 RepID=A0ABN8G3A5_9BACL|nr:DNA alkylation repair protein [Paenibacillus plantiphilus]CAH1195632.1 hypothetical protein PAECIP111893_00732 [Paenibacillus plantiphilus]
MEKAIKDQLLELADTDYQKFAAALIPTINNLVGVRLPELRKLAKRIAKDDWRAYLKEADNQYFEETMLQGMVIGYAGADIEESLRCTADFVPKIDNWSVCDCFCIGLKFTKTNKGRVWDFLQPYLKSEQEYELRFGAVMLLNFYIEEEYINEVLELLDRVKHDGYYIKMAVAWAVSICYMKLPEPTMTYLRTCSLDDFTYNKALQKMTESFRVDKETKLLIRSMKRK